MRLSTFKIHVDLSGRFRESSSESITDMDLTSNQDPYPMVVPHGVYDPRNAVFGTFLISFSLGLNRFCQIVFENKLCKVREKNTKIIEI